MSAEGRRGGPGRLPAHVVLVGLMGSGKTSVGRALAEALARPLLDSDDEIVARTGRTVRELWEAGGEAAYRSTERQVLLDALAGPGPDVVAAAAGTIDDEAVRRALAAADAFVVWLQADVDTLVVRAGAGAHRPLLADDPEGVLARQAAARSSRYGDVADLVLDAAHDPPAVLARSVLRALGPEGP